MLVACQAADGTTQAPDKALVGALMSGLGAVDPNAKPIEYKPRAPLAMPANSGALPEPQTKIAGKGNANWPTSSNNAEINRVKGIYAEGDDPSERLTLEQMRGLSISSGKQRDFENEERTRDILSGSEMTLKEMEAQRDNPNAPNSDAALLQRRQKALERKYLTEPPTAYSVPSDKADMPLIAQEEKARGADYDKYDTGLIDMRCAEETGGECRRGKSSR